MAAKKETFRRAPQQPRAGQRIEQVLEAAAAVMAESGFEAATMTAIADRAGASIGTLYVYFPDKQAIMLALNNRYGEAIEKSFAELEHEAHTLSVQQIAHRFVDITVGFVSEHPAYFKLSDAPPGTGRDPRDRERLRHRIGTILRSKQPRMSTELAYAVANVSIQIIKGMNPLYASADAKGKTVLVREYKRALTAYMETHLSPLAT